MDKHTYRVLVAVLLLIITITQLASCMCAEYIMTDTAAIQQEVKTIRKQVDGWEVEVRY